MGRAAVLLTVLTAGSAVLGLVRDMVIAVVYGAGGALDAYFVAQGLMNVVLGLVASAMAMAKASVPVLARQVGEDRAAAAARTMSVVLTTTVVVLGVAAVVMGPAAGPWSRCRRPGWGPTTHVSRSS
ncbi:MAG TPA: hypothetical protein VGE77_04300 [Nocardioides sp.]